MGTEKMQEHVGEIKTSSSVTNSVAKVGKATEATEATEVAVDSKAMLRH